LHLLNYSSEKSAELKTNRITMFNYLTSYLYSAPANDAAQKGAEPKEQSMTQFEVTSQPAAQEEALPADQPSAPQGGGGGLLNTIYTKMSGHPTCDVVLNFNPNRKYFTAGDDLRGRICIKTAVEGQNI
jgi:hypothetical protein